MVQFYKAKKGRSGSAKKPGKLTHKPSASKLSGTDPQSQQQLSLTIDVIDSKGQGICKQHQPIVFVSGALPGEQVLCQVTEQKAQYWHAKTMKVEQASEHRQTPFCPHYEACGGCQTQHVSAETMRAYKQNAVSDMLSRATGLSSLPWQTAIFEPAQEQTQEQARQYRRKTRLAIDARQHRSEKPQVKLGFRGAKGVLNIEHCPILVPELDALLKPLQQLCAKLQNPKAIGHISLFKGDSQTQVCVRLTKTLSQADMQSLQDFADAQDCQLVLDQGKDQFRYLNEQTPASYQPQANIELHIQPNDFVQVNRQVNQSMVAQAMAWLALTEDDYLLDLFAGVGNFSLPAARLCAHVHGVEGVTEMVQRASDNAHLNNIHNATFAQTDLSQQNHALSSLLQQGNKLLLDPARDGAFAVAKALPSAEQKDAFERILYVSCNPATFCRDAAVLIEKGYRLDKISLVDMFPYTAHTELMALFC